MKKINKEIVIIVLGLLGGLSSWPFLELVLSNQSSFSNYLVFFIVATMMPGLALGFFIGCGEGLINKSFSRVIKGS
ncbi:MAG: phosphopeptide-binding protein, partial [bacterium]|nr:phosphopeptide-binding protein [bacterium]